MNLLSIFKGRNRQPTGSIVTSDDTTRLDADIARDVAAGEAETVSTMDTAAELIAMLADRAGVPVEDIERDLDA